MSIFFKIVKFFALCVAVYILLLQDKKNHIKHNGVSVFSGVVVFLYITTAIVMG